MTAKRRTLRQAYDLINAYDEARDNAQGEDVSEESVKAYAQAYSNLLGALMGEAAS